MWSPFRSEKYINPFLLGRNSWTRKTFEQIWQICDKGTSCHEPEFQGGRKIEGCGALIGGGGGDVVGHLHHAWLRSFLKIFAPRALEP